MGIVIDQFNTLYIGGSKGKKFEIRFCPKCVEAPWSVQSRGNGHYFMTLRETLAFVAGRGWIGSHEIMKYANEIAANLDRKWDE